MSELITREFCGRTLFEVRERLMEAMAEEKAACDRILARALELGQRALEETRGQEQIYVDGTAQLLDKPEFSDVDSLRRVFSDLRGEGAAARPDDAVPRLQGETCVVLGSEEDAGRRPAPLRGPDRYGTGETLAGTLGVIGPARREYPRVIPVVELLGRALSERLERRETRETEGAPAMTRRRRTAGAAPRSRRTPATIEVEDPGADAGSGPRGGGALGHRRRPRRSSIGSSRTSTSSRTATCASSPSSRTCASAPSGRRASTSGIALGEFPRSTSSRSPTASTARSPTPRAEERESGPRAGRRDDPAGSSTSSSGSTASPKWTRPARFDPNVHEAVATEATNGGARRTRSWRSCKGYFLNDKLAQTRAGQGRRPESRIGRTRNRKPEIGDRHESRAPSSRSPIPDSRFPAPRGSHGQDPRNRSRHDELLRRGRGGRDAAGDLQPRGEPDDPLDRRASRRTTSGWSGRSPSGRRSPTR